MPDELEQRRRQNEEMMNRQTDLQRPNRGNSRRKQAPAPCRPRQRWSRPPSMRDQRVARARPSPTPPAVVSAPPPRRNGRNTARHSRLPTPGPQSSTSSAIFSLPIAAARRKIRLSAAPFEYLQALSIKLPRI